MSQALPSKAPCPSLPATKSDPRPPAQNASKDLRPTWQAHKRLAQLSTARKTSKRPISRNVNKSIHYTKSDKLARSLQGYYRTGQRRSAQKERQQAFTEDTEILFKWKKQISVI
ncbi:hypothetical protein FHT80_002753 [Rhizobium sp. BK226]|jgi:hypothetical protein|nr:hypothetical protein [Rhizobium sp. BK226]